MADRLECEIGEIRPDGARVVTVRGEVDLATAPDLEEQARRALQGASGSVVLDLEALTFIDSSGLRVLVTLSNEARTRGGSLALRNVPRHARRVLDVTGLSDWFGPEADA